MSRSVEWGAALFLSGTILAAAAHSEERAPAALQQCGDCHMVFPAAMLPERSWAAIVAGLANHFGENADLSAKDKAAILAYLSAHAADSPNATARERHFLSELPSDTTPMRITQTRWWNQMHADYNFQASKHPKLKSPADCQACHENGFN